MTYFFQSFQKDFGLWLKYDKKKTKLYGYHTGSIVGTKAV